ncbi:MAG TPA: hypothetical protein VHZ78_01615 [Rhizomicrobium sp.]|nr:hypothetical protein [Rhizomicrobium sp.]
MTDVHETWTVLPRGPLTRVDDGILTVTGTLKMPLVHLERRMTVIRLAYGSSVIYSAVALDEDEMQQIEAFGTPRYLIVPGIAHRVDAKIFKQRYPSIRVIAPEGARERVAKAVPVDAAGADFADPDVTLLTVPGTKGYEAALVVRRASGTTLILNDLIGNLRRKDGFEGWLLHLMGFGGAAPQIPTVEKLFMVGDKAALRVQLLAWADEPGLVLILMSHGEPIEHDPVGALRTLADTLQ